MKILKRLFVNNIMEEIETLIAKFYLKEEEEVFIYTDELAKMGGAEVKGRMLKLLFEDNEEVQYLAAATLSKIKDNQDILPDFFAAINHPLLRNRNSSLVEALSGFDVSDYFVDILKWYLIGGLKTSAMAKLLFDYTEFNITPRILKKARKHLHHFEYNSPKDDRSELKHYETMEILNDLEALLGGTA